MPEKKRRIAVIVDIGASQGDGRASGSMSPIQPARPAAPITTIVAARIREAAKQVCMERSFPIIIRSIYMFVLIVYIVNK